MSTFTSTDNIQDIDNQLSKAINDGDVNKVKEILSSTELQSCKIWSVSEGYDLLCEVIKQNKLTLAQSILEHGCRINSPSVASTTPLHLAAENGAVTLVENLLEKGAALDTRDQAGCTALHIAVKNNNVDIVSLLFRKGASVNVSDNNGMSPLHDASDNVEMLSKVLEYNALIDVKNNQNSTPLHCAAECGSPDVVELLLQKGAFIDAVNDKGETPLLLAPENKDHRVIVTLLNAGASVNVQNSLGESVLHVLIKKIRMSDEIFRDFLNLEKIRHWSISDECLPVLELLISKGVDLDASDKDTMTPLLCAIDAGAVSVVKLLLAKGCDVNKKTWDDVDAFYLAASNGDQFLFQLLLDYGGKIVVCEKKSMTTLYHAVQSRCDKIVELILNNCDVALERYYDLLKKLLAAKDFHMKKILKMFVEKGFRFRPDIIKDTTYVTAVISNGHLEVFEDMVQYGLDLNTHLKGGFNYCDNSTPLHIAIKNGKKNMVDFLLSHGAQVDVVDSYQCYPLLLAIDSSKCYHDQRYYYNCRSFDMPDNCLELIETLLQWGSNVNCMNLKNLTPLHVGVASGSVGVVKLLLKYAANTNCTDKFGYASHHLAFRQRKLEIYKFLLNSGMDITITDKNSATDTDKNSSTFTTEKTATLFDYIKKGTGLRNVNPEILESPTEVMLEFLRHLTKLEVADSVSIHPNVDLLTKLVSTDYREKCIAEISRMKDDRIGSLSISFYHILHMAPSRLVFFWQNEVFRSAMETRAWTQTYPIYGGILDFKLSTSERRKNLLEELDPIFKKILTPLPDVVTRLIVDYITDSELNRLVALLKNKPFGSDGRILIKSDSCSIEAIEVPSCLQFNGSSSIILRNIQII